MPRLVNDNLAQGVDMEHIMLAHEIHAIDDLSCMANKLISCKPIRMCPGRLQVEVKSHHRS